MMIYMFAGIAIVGLMLSLWLSIKNYKTNQAIELAEKRIQFLEAQLEARPDTETVNAKLRKKQEKYEALESKVSDLFQSAQNLGTQPTIEGQINQLEEFFDNHFKKMPPQVPVFCNKLRGLVVADQRIKLLHTQVMRPLQSMLYTQEITDDRSVQQLVLARMLDALWLSYDAVETLADRDNMRNEQLYALDLLNGTKTRQEISSLARPITSDPEKTPKWLRVIRRAVLPLNLDSQYQVLYSGYKLTDRPISTDQENTNN